MTTFREPAPAKINLTLEVAGRRADGLHALASLVAFADVGDTVTLDLEREPGVSVSGPFADRLVGANILDQVLSSVQERAPHLRLGAVHLVKDLPVAAGVGGGSADAGALLRALKCANSSERASVDWAALARGLGADVPVCFDAQAAWMTGSGAALSKVAGGVPVLDAVLVNPQADVPADKTAQVFRALAAPPLPSDYAVPPPPAFRDREDALAFMRARGNDLAEAAAVVVPEVREVLDALGRAGDVQYVALSGAGPTAFGVFPDAVTAERACALLSDAHPDWWCRTVRLG